MPTSVYYQITPLVEIILAVQPRSILDIGAGTGKYGLLAREYLDIWGQANGLYDKSLWQHRIDAIEIFEQYITPVYKYVYDEIFVGDAVEIVPEISRYYDLVLLVDIIEHIDKERGKQLLRMLRRKSQALLISVPRKTGLQKALFNNPYEIHRSQWKKSDFLEIDSCSFIRCRDKLICIMGQPGIIAWRTYRRRKFRKAVRNRFPMMANLYNFLRKVIVQLLSNSQP